MVELEGVVEIIWQLLAEYTQGRAGGSGSR
jgi:hypothetical protein